MTAGRRSRAAARRPGRVGPGFTLLEVLISISIFAICVSVVYALYGSIMTVVNSAEDRSAMSSRVQVTLEQLGMDLTGLYQAEQGMLVAKKPGDYTDEPIMEFFSTSHLSYDPEAVPVGLTLIRYYLEQEEEAETYSLLRSDTPVVMPTETGELAEKGKLVVCEGLRELILDYADRDGRDNDEWDSPARDENTEEGQYDPNRFPTRVTITLVFPGSDEEAGERYSTAVWLRPKRYDSGEDRDGL